MIKKCVECGKEIDMDKEDWVWFSGTGVVCKRCFELKPRVQTPPHAVKTNEENSKSYVDYSLLGHAITLGNKKIKR